MDTIQKAFDLLKEKLFVWFEKFIAMLPNYLLALLILLLFIIAARYAGKASYKILQKVTQTNSINKFVSYVVSALVLLFGLFIVLDIVHLDKTFASLLAGAGILGLAFSLGFQDVVANFVSSFMIATRKPYKIGDIIESNDVFGNVRKINMRSTHLDTPEGQRVVIPNRLLYQSPMRNYTLLGKRRIDLELSISYSDNMQNVEGIVITAINKIDILPSTEVEFFYTKFGDFGIHLVVRYWIKFSRQAAYMKAVSDGMKNIKTAFDENDIVIPFPIRTLDFGVNGGKHLSQVLDNRSNDGKTPTD